MGSGWDMSIQQLGCKKGRGRARLLAVGQDSRFPISRKGTGAMVPRCHVGKEFGSQGKTGGLNSRDWGQKAKSTCLRPGAGGRGGKGEEEGGGCPGGTEQWGGRGGGAVTPAAVSFRTGQGRCRPQGQERGCWAQACWPPPARRRRGWWQCQEGEWPEDSALRWSCCH